MSHGRHGTSKLSTGFEGIEIELSRVASLQTDLCIQGDGTARLSSMRASNLLYNLDLVPQFLPPIKSGVRNLRLTLP